MRKQLSLLNSAVSAYFSGNQQALETTMKNFCIKYNSNKTSPISNSSWLGNYLLIQQHLFVISVNNSFVFFRTNQ